MFFGRDNDDNPSSHRAGIRFRFPRPTTTGSMANKGSDRYIIVGVQLNKSLPLNFS